MTPPLIILDRQHAGKPGHPGDRGAWEDLDGDTRRDQWEAEAQLTPYYLLAAEECLLAAGVDVISISDGAYEERHARACRYQAAAYVAAHLNAGGARDGAAFHDRRSAPGLALASELARQLQAHCPELGGDVRGLPCWDDRPQAGADAWLWRPWTTIRGVYQGRPVGICYEPACLDTPQHAPLLTREGLARIGQALGRGVLAWLEVAQ